MLSALVATLVLAAPTTYEVALRTEGRSSPQAESDLQLDPSLSLNIPLGRISLSAFYTPRILVFEPQARTKVGLLQRGRLRGERRSSRGGRVFLEQQGEYGEASFSWLVVAAEGGQPSFDRLAQLPPLRYFSESTVLGVEQTVSRRLLVSATAAYSVSGGANADARATVPIQHSPRLGLSLAWLVARRDALVASAGGSAAYFPGGQRSYVVDTNAGWRHQFARNTELEVAAGASGALEVRPRAGETPGVRDTRVYPFVAGGFRWRTLPGARHYFSGNLRVRLAPAIDPLDGSIYPRSEIFASLDYSPVSKFILAAAGGAAVALSGSLSGQTLGFGGFSASYEFTHHFALGIGIRAVSQPTVQWAGFLAASVSDHGHL